jgi:signal recognition particle subunit SRP54
MTGQDIVNVAQAFNEALPLTGLVVTKFDGDSRGGGVLSVKKITGVPVKFVGEGEKLDDMGVFYPDRMADRILGMGDVVSLVERAQEKMDLEETEKMAERMMNGQFTMEDMLKQFEQIEKLGPLSGIIKMLPGMAQYAPMLDEAKAGDTMKHTKAIIQSMTPYERKYPARIRGTMKKRIAAGSGTTVNDVNRLINQFNRMKKTMDSIGSMAKNGTFNEESLEKMMENAQNQQQGKLPQGRKIRYR